MFPGISANTPPHNAKQTPKLAKKLKTTLFIILYIIAYSLKNKTPTIILFLFSYNGFKKSIPYAILDKAMKDYIEISIIIDNSLIFDLHETVSSIIEQIGKERLDIHVLIHNPNNLKIDQEQKRLLNAGIKLVDRPTKARFTLSIQSGEIVSRSFLYKGVYFLKTNSAHFVCPEYSFRRIENTLIIATTHNDKMLCNNTTINLFDNKKQAEHPSFSPRAHIIKDTCSASRTVNIDFNKFIKTIKNEPPYFDSSLFSQLDITHTDKPSIFKSSANHRSFKNSVKTLLKTSAGKSRIAKRLLRSNKNHSGSSLLFPQQPTYISNSMRDELEQLSTIKYGLKGYRSMKFVDITHEIFYQSEQLLEAYYTVLKTLDYIDYSYFMVLPWLISGGVDLFATNYLRTLSSLLPNQHILVFLTNGTHKSFNKEDLHLPSNITLVDLPLIFKNNNLIQKLFPQIIYSTINAFQPERIHIIASKAGYDCLEQYGDIMRKNGSKILFSSYNYLVGPNGEYMGYTVQELPVVYRPGDIITTDNNSSKDLWVNHFGFLPDDILVHHQLFEYNNDFKPDLSAKDGIRILWAAHIRPEKNPEIVPIIAEALKKDHVSIDCYGLFSPINWPNGDNPLDTNTPNLHYKGAYSNFFKDINLSQYDIFLYTSHADGTPNVIIEAALSGLPIVSSSVGGIPDALGDCATLVEDSTSPEQFIQAIRNTVANHTTSLQKAATLQRTLQQRHNKDTFMAQVKEMLKRSKHV